MNGMSRLIASAALLSCFLFSSFFLCGCGKTTKTLAGGYRLERFNENGKHYLISPENDLSGGGVFDGTVEEIGWNQDWILARVTRLAQSDTNGWYALDLKTKHVVGPIQESEVKTNAAWSKIDCRESEQVFSGK